MIEYGHEIKEDVKPRQSEKKQNIQGREGKGREYTNSEGKETGTQINDLEQKEETNIQNRMKK